MFPFLKKSPWCTVLHLLLSLQPPLPPQVYPTQQQRQPIRFAPLYSFLSLILQLWISALSFNQDWLHHHSTALLSLLKAPSTHRASIELDSVSPCVLITDYIPFHTKFSTLQRYTLFFIIYLSLIAQKCSLWWEMCKCQFPQAFHAWKYYIHS